jgi:tetratricopeptide (TPR) repeat protein
MGLREMDRQSDPDDEMRALLLKQIYTCRMEAGRFHEALDIAEEIVEFGTLADVARQDAARAALALGSLDSAVAHLEIAARVGPPERRSFHLATLGAWLRFGGRAHEAETAFREATRSAEGDRSLFSAQLALAQVDAGQKPSRDLKELRLELEQSESQRGYHLWVLGELCAKTGDHAATRRYMEAFLQRLEGASPVKCISLQGEIARAEELLAETG